MGSGLCLVLVALLIVAQVRAFGIQVPAGGMASCFFREIHANSRVSVHFVARETVNVQVTNPSGSVLFSKQASVEGEHTFDSKQDGPYQICVSTDFMRRVPTMTKFRFLVLDPSILTPDIADSMQAFDVALLCKDVFKVAEKALYTIHLFSDTAMATDDALISSIALTGRLAALECVSVLVVALSQITRIRNMLATTRSRLQRMV